MTESAPDAEQVASFLEERHESTVMDLEPLSGGFWSSAYGYRTDGADLVLRLGTVSEGFEMDRMAMAFAGVDLPVPRVLEVGDALGMAYAISERHRGRFLEDVEPDEVDRAGPALMRLLTALRENRAPADSPAAWEPGASPRSTWRSWLTDALRDDPGRRVSGWRATLAGDPALDTLHRACEARIDGLLEACPERRDLVHGDLLHGNVLIAEDASQVTAVFSWKCSVRGDFLFDTAWCTFWGGWHPGIAAVDAWSRTLKSAPPADLVDAPIRHHCYELQIGASHLGWNAWTGNTDELRRTAARTAEVLERGPRPA